VKNFEHKPVLLAEVLAALQPHPGGQYADGTIGGAGHTAAILEASSPNGFLSGCDRDGAAVEAAQDRLQVFAGRFEIRRGNFDELSNWVEQGSCDGVLLDLGVSSPQLDLAERGFSFSAEGPLDMRMDRRQPLTAAVLVNEASPEELADIFWRYGDEHQSRKMARAIERERSLRPIQTTRQLAELVEKISPRAGKKSHPATKIFQALRIAVNDEIGSLKRGLNGSLKILKPGGRLAVITFHSLEDRMVKEWGRTLARDYEFEGEVDVPELRKPVQPKVRLVTRKAILPGDVEVHENPRSRSAQLRVFEKI
jgi:16S rRNA (cytosine1402-N4)-methyltransferase